MTAIQEFLIQSNLPVLVLTITIVCIVVLGYLEYRNIVDRFDMLENRFESLTKKVKKDIESFESNNNSKETSPTMKDENVEGKEDSVDDKEDTIEVKVDVSSPKENKKEDVLSQLPTSLERMDPVQAMFSSMAGAGMMRGPSVMMEIPSSRNTFNEFKFEEEQILSETGSHVSEKDNKIEEDFEKLKGDKEKDKEKDKSKEEEDYDSYSEESYTESEEDEKDEKVEKVEKVDVKKININDGMSVSELKAICKSKNLSVSGNKAQLIERINSK